MLRFFAQRLSQAIIVMMVVACVAFALSRYAGDPINNLVGQDTSEAERDALRQMLGLDRPVLVQFAHYIVAVVGGDFGMSYRYRRPVKELIAERLAATLELTSVAALLALAIGIPVGVYTAVHRAGVISRVLMIISLLGVSIPTFLLGLLLILLFGVVLGWLPTYGRGEVVEIGWWSTGLLTWSGIKALTMPSMTLTLYQMTLIMRLVRSGMLDVLQSDFIKFARARGLSPRSIYYTHALENTLLPVCTIVGLQFGIPHRLRSSHRAGFSMAWSGPAVHSGGQSGRCPLDNHLSCSRIADVCCDQSDRGHALLPYRPAATRRQGAVAWFRPVGPCEDKCRRNSNERSPKAISSISFSTLPPPSRRVRSF